jgi:hypothetical protein
MTVNIPVSKDWTVCGLLSITYFQLPYLVFLRRQHRVLHSIKGRRVDFEAYLLPCCHICNNSIKAYSQVHTYYAEKFDRRFLLAVLKCSFYQTLIFLNIISVVGLQTRSQWPLSLRHELSSPFQTLGSWVRIPHEAWVYMRLFCVCDVLCTDTGLATVWSLV